MPELRFAIFEGYSRRMVSARITDAIAKLPDDKDWEVVIKAKVRKRSLDQNNFFHGIVRDIAAQSGEDPAKVKELMKAQFGLREAVSGIGDAVVEINKPTENYSVEEMSAMITRMLVWLESFGFDVADHRANHAAQG